MGLQLTEVSLLSAPFVSTAAISVISIHQIATIALKCYNHPAFLITSYDSGCYKQVTISAAIFLASKSDA